MKTYAHLTPKFIFKFFILCSFLIFLCSCSDYDIEIESPNCNVITKSTNSNTDEWDWTNPTNYTYAYIQGKGAVQISSPFNTFSTPNKDLSLIIAQKDYLPQQGWVLLDHVLGTPSNMVETPYPYFLLYNKYRGIIRAFILNTNQNEHNKAIISLEWGLGNKSALLTLANEFPLADEAYTTQNATEKITNIIDDYYSSAWFISDFIVSFDHNLKPTQNYNLNLKIYSQIQSNLEISGKFHFETTSASLIGNSNSTQYNDILGKAGNFINKLPSSKDIENGLNQLKLKIDTTHSEKKTLYNQIAKLSNSLADGSFGKVLKDFGSISSGLKGTVGVLTSIFKIFIGKSTTSAPTYVELMPTVSDGTATLSGTITTQTNATQCILQLPGTNHKYPDGSVNNNGLPIYDKPLGIFSLEKIPTIKRKTIKTIWITKIPRPNGRGDTELKRSDICQNYQFDDNIHIALNKECGLDYVCGTAQLISYDLPKHDSKQPECRMNYFAKNIYTMINDSSYSTLPIDLNKFKKTTFISRGNHIYLKLTLVFKPTDMNAEQTPIIFSQMYLLTKFIDEGKTQEHEAKDNWINEYSYPMTTEQYLHGTVHGQNALILTKY